MLKKSWVQAALVVAGFGIVAGAASPAFAYTSSITGCLVESDGSWLHVRDTAGDSHSVYGLYHKGTSTATYRLDNSSGVNTTVSKDVGSTITGVRACLNYQLFPDICGNWS